MKNSLESCNENYKSAQLYAKGDNWADLKRQRSRLVVLETKRI
jgi:hypothetical protein